MKKVIFILFFFIFNQTVLGQSKDEGCGKEVKLDSLLQVRTIEISSLEYQLLLSRKENEALRRIMRGYIVQIDSLSRVILKNGKNEE